MIVVVSNSPEHELKIKLFSTAAWLDADAWFKRGECLDISVARMLYSPKSKYPYRIFSSRNQQSLCSAPTYNTHDHDSKNATNRNQKGQNESPRRPQPFQAEQHELLLHLVLACLNTVPTFHATAKPERTTGLVLSIVHEVHEDLY
jgi:hypothetical protein